MFALLDSSTHTNNSLNLVWQRSADIKALHNHGGAIKTSMLDKLAAPTVFMQQTLVYPDGLNPDLLEASVQQVINGSPIIGARLTQQDGQLQLFINADSGIRFMQGTMSSLTMQQLLAGVPTLSSNSTSGGSDGASATTTTGTTPTTPRQLSRAATPGQHQQQQQQLKQQLLVLPDLPDALFSRLPGALTPHYIDSPELALVHVALVSLSGGGSVLGLRMSHLLGDWGSARLLLRSIAAAYSYLAGQLQLQHQSKHKHNITNASQQPLHVAECSEMRRASCHSTAVDSSSGGRSGKGLVLPKVVSAAPLLNSLVLECIQQMGRDYTPVRLKPMEPADTELFTKLAQLSSSTSSNDMSGEGKTEESSSDGQPQRLTYHVLPDRIQLLKQAAHASVAAPPTAAGEGSNCVGLQCADRVFTSHNVLLATVAKAFCSLPGRVNVPHDIAISVDMRSRVPTGYLKAADQQQQQQVESGEQRHDAQEQLQAAVGNFFGTAIVEDCLPGLLSVGKLAQQVHEAIASLPEMWLPDLGWASNALGISAGELAGQDNRHDHQAARDLAALGTCNKQQVAWRRLHAMGPRKLLQQQLALGLLASLSATQWPLNYAEDACMAGQLPVLALPGFSQPQPYPLVILQQAPTALGGGMLVHVWLDGAEAAHMQHAVDALGGV